MTKDDETSRLSSYQHSLYITLWCQKHKPYSDAIEITLKELLSLASIRLRGVIMRQTGR